jgi:hypothetical protein
MGAAKGAMAKTERAAAKPKYGAMVNKNRSAPTGSKVKLKFRSESTCLDLECQE